MKRKILYISMCLPFDKAFHAGGKTLCYYINQFANDSNNEVTLIAKVLPDEEIFVRQVNAKIKLYTVSTPKRGLKRHLAYLKSINSKFNPVYKYGNTLTYEIYKQIEMHIRNLKGTGYSPDVVILEWTSMLLFINKVKDYFPNAVYVASEHDVTFLGKMRQYKNRKNKIWRYIGKVSYEAMKKHELAAADKCNLVVTHNHKDKKLLLDAGISSDKLDVIAPYYDKFPCMDRTPNHKDIIFYGAMNRGENSSSAIWFINNVMPLLDDCDVKFIVIGNKPPKELLELQGDRVLVTGFVDDPAPYFRTAMCLVAPLLLGAGVKVKIIEALSSGIPVLTNDIGIEGIDAENGKDYFHCVAPKDYEKVIKDLINNRINIKEVSWNAHSLIEEKYNLQASYDNYSNRIYQLLMENKNDCNHYS